MPMLQTSQDTYPPTTLTAKIKNLPALSMGMSTGCSLLLGTNQRTQYAHLCLWHS